MTQRNRTKAQQRRDEREADLAARLADGIDHLSTTGDWQRYLDFQAQFPTYSFGNVMLIRMQCPHASALMGYGNKQGTSGWLSVGRQVKGPDPVTGEKQHAIWIRKPAFKTVRDENDPEDEGRTLRRFIWVPVFDISQTEGDPIPEPVRLLQGEAPEGALAAVTACITGLGYTVEFVDQIDGPHGPNGRTIWASRRVLIRTDGRSALSQLKTCLHEAGHVLLHKDSALPGGHKELEAESVAYIAAQGLGVESGGYSFGYVLTWSGGDPAKAREMIKASGSRIQGAARTILEGMGAVAKIEFSQAA